ncbi:glutathione-disulfide reductase [Candidatus Viadribacter manganicus]|uniref:Glutathione reductase n=1 Tax=Candidatus Viadribacter manganicus TaxID=1759059 RepID=A0A1B1ALJ5_9PROT|nr:glutathione-disulfide reductase [Candidatus Viadribacter manganicus]ANP47433.1 glutathione reductase [Candidatus Viadribacter manganicus]
MPQHDYDLIVIGAGSGGVRAARLAAKTGAKVAITEQVQVGGTCVLRGCVPKKLLVYASEYSQAFRDAKGFGWTVDWARFDWTTLRDSVQAEVSRLSGLYLQNLTNAGVELFEDRAVLTDPHTVRLVREGRYLSSDKILIATGGHTYRPEETPGQELGITSTDAFLLKDLPSRVVIAGGGFIAAEFATIFSGLGVETTIVYRGERILRGFDHDVRAHVQADLARSGVNIICGSTIDEIAPLAADRKLVTLSNSMRIEADQVLWAVGRVPNTMNMGLEAAGVRLTERGAVAVDEYSRSSVPHISAVGDVTDRVNLTPVAIREAMAYVATEFLSTPTAFDHADVASAVFSRPPVGAVGLTEEAARAKGRKLKIFRSTFRPMKHILAGNEQKTLMKMIVDVKTDQVLGVHIVGADAPEIIQVAAVAVKAKLTKAQWDLTCAVHPTAAEELVLMGEPVSHDNEAPA